MKSIKRILAPTDFSQLSQAGVRYALEMAKFLGAEVIVYHVIGVAEEWLASHDEFYSVKEFVGEQKGIMDDLLRENFAGILSQVTIRAEVEVGVPHKMIIEKAIEEKVDIIVMSTRGKSGLSRVIIGSVTEKVVGRAPCPVLSIPPLIRSDRTKAAA